jgi:single-strand DNA-binding protein
MAYELKGTVKEIFDEQTFDSGFNKRAFVVTSEADKFPQEVQFECLKERVELVGKLSKGDKVNVSFDINGREWNGKYFVNLVAWKIDSDSSSSAGAASGDEPPLPDPDEDFDQDPPF